MSKFNERDLKSLDKAEIQALVRECSFELAYRSGLEVVEEAATKIGKCYRYRNNYSYPEPKDKKWWMYFRAESAEGHWLKGLKFEITCDGQYMAEIAVLQCTLTGHQEITQKQFDVQWAKFCKKVKTLDRRLK